MRSVRRLPNCSRRRHLVPLGSVWSATPIESEWAVEKVRNLEGFRHEKLVQAILIYRGQLKIRLDLKIVNGLLVERNVVASEH